MQAYDRHFQLWYSEGTGTSRFLVGTYETESAAGAAIARLDWCKAQWQIVKIQNSLHGTTGEQVRCIYCNEIYTYNDPAHKH
jgi:hypothetical protein